MRRSGQRKRKRSTTGVRFGETVIRSVGAPGVNRGARPDKAARRTRAKVAPATLLRVLYQIPDAKVPGYARCRICALPPKHAPVLKCGCINCRGCLLKRTERTCPSCGATVTKKLWKDTGIPLPPAPLTFD